MFTCSMIALFDIYLVLIDVCFSFDAITNCCGVECIVSNNEFNLCFDEH